jgi:hypothetical protein
MADTPSAQSKRRPAQIVWWWNPETWGIRANPAYTLRSREPISRVPIYRWRFQVGPMEVRRWNWRQTPSRHYRGFA